MGGRYLSPTAVSVPLASAPGQSIDLCRRLAALASAGQGIRHSVEPLDAPEDGHPKSTRHRPLDCATVMSKEVTGVGAGDKLPKRLQGTAKAHLHAIMYAPIAPRTTTR